VTGYLGKGGVLRDSTVDKILIGHRKNGAPIYQAMGGAPDELEQLEARQRELIDLMDAAQKDSGDETRSVQQRKDDGATFDKYEAEYKENEAKIDGIRAVVKEREEREQRVKAARAKYGDLNVRQPGDKDGIDRFNVDYRRMGTDETREQWHSRASAILDDKKIQRHLTDYQRSRLDTLLRRADADTDGELIAAFLVATSNPYYRSAFQKAATGHQPVFSPEEARAVQEVNYLKRAMAIGTPAAGGFAVPVIIDPTIILTAQGSDNPVLNRCRIETITNDQWKGLASAGVTWKYDQEAAPSNDNSPTLAQPAVPTHRADGFIPFSIEVGQDWPGFAQRMSEMLGSGYDELLADKLTTGTGANLPTGIIPALTGQTSPVVSTPVGTAGTIATTDIYNIWARLPQRHRRRGSVAWMSSTKTQNATRQLGTLDPNFTVNLSADGIGQVFGREWDQNDYMTDITTGTGAQPWLVVGNWQGYLFAQRAGMNIEFVPMLFDVTNNRPTGQRGWFAWARNGANVIDPTAFQLLTNKTS
jgi:HK97 family phage major capsid protein